jgi:hypothetical protein
VDEIRIAARGGHGYIALHRAENGTQRLRAPEPRIVGGKTADRQIPLSKLLRSEAAHLHRHEPRKLT